MKMMKNAKRMTAALLVGIMLLAALAVPASAGTKSAKTTYYIVSMTRKGDIRAYSSHKCYSTRLTLGNKKISGYGRIYKSSSRQQKGTLTKAKKFSFKLTGATKYYTSDAEGFERISQKGLYRGIRSYRSRHKENFFVLAVKAGKVTSIYASA